MDNDSGPHRLIVAITGASGAIYGIRALFHLSKVPAVETHLIISAAGKRTIIEETDYTVASVSELADVSYDPRDIGAAVASGSFRTAGMLIAPCSVKTLSSVAYSHDGELISRAADVCLKERRRIVLMVRETPLHAGHIEMMAAATRSGAIIMPPVPAFYSKPANLEELVDHSIGRALDLFEIDTALVKRWG